VRQEEAVTVTPICNVRIAVWDGCIRALSASDGANARQGLPPGSGAPSFALAKGGGRLIRRLVIVPHPLLRNEWGTRCNGWGTLPGSQKRMSGRPTR